jgi:hypothetical protein
MIFFSLLEASRNEVLWSSGTVDAVQIEHNGTQRSNMKYRDQTHSEKLHVNYM